MYTTIANRIYRYTIGSGKLIRIDDNEGGFTPVHLNTVKGTLENIPFVGVFQLRTSACVDVCSWKRILTGYDT